MTLGVSADDGTNPAYVKSLIFTVNDLNDNPPTDLQAAATSFDENAAFAATLSATDADSDAVNAFTGIVTLIKYRPNLALLSEAKRLKMHMATISE